jgi:hypothetical protein
MNCILCLLKNLNFMPVGNISQIKYSPESSLIDLPLLLKLFIN